MKLIHLTDTHLVPKGSKLFGRDPRVVLEALLQAWRRGDA